MNPTVILIDHKKMYENATACLYDLMQEEIDNDALISIIGGLRNRKTLLKSFMDGYSVMFLGDTMELVEQLNKEKLPFVIMVIKDVKVFATIVNDDVRY